MADWVRPRTIREQLSLISRHIGDGVDQNTDVWPPAGSGVYVIAREPWEGSDEPPKSSRVLYIGKDDGKQRNQLRKRIGDLIVGSCGYFDEDTGYHTFPFKFREKYSTADPLELHISWAEAECASCAENRLYDKFKGDELLNGPKPSGCASHPNGHIACVNRTAESNSASSNSV